MTIKRSKKCDGYDKEFVANYESNIRFSTIRKIFKILHKTNSRSIMFIVYIEINLILEIIE